MTEVVQPCECGRVLSPDGHHCWWHHTDENPEGAYVVCGECFHVYRTAADLEAAFDRAVEGQADARHLAADEIHFCQECCHDF